MLPLEVIMSSFYATVAAGTVKSLQSCPTLCDPRDSSPSGSPVPGILQARVLEWGAIALNLYYYYPFANDETQDRAVTGPQRHEIVSPHL